MSVPTQIRIDIFETAVVMAAIRWHIANDDSPGPRHADPDDEDAAAIEGAQAADRLHEAVAALAAEYRRQDERKTA